MHHVNREMTTKYKNMKARYTEEHNKNNDSVQKLIVLINEINHLKDKIVALEADLNHTRNRESVLINDKERVQIAMDEIQAYIGKLEKEVKETKEDLGISFADTTKFQMANQTLNNFITSKANDQNNSQSFLDQVCI